MIIIIKKSNKETLNRIALYIDFDGVILDTNRYTRNEILKKYGVDKWTHKRSNIEDDKKIGQFYKEFKWSENIDKIPEISLSLTAIQEMMYCGLFYGPTIYTACTTLEEEQVKREFLNSKFKNIDIIAHTDIHKPKRIFDGMPYYSNNMIIPPVLIDDDPFNLNSWEGYSLPFNGGNPNYDFPAMEDLRETFDIWKRINSNGQIYIPRYDDGSYQKDDIVQDFNIDPNTQYIVTNTMKKNLILRKTS